jgi:hypothetical protein
MAQIASIVHLMILSLFVVGAPYAGVPTMAAQDDESATFNVPIFAINCAGLPPIDSSEFDQALGIAFRQPTVECDPATGVEFTVTDATTSERYGHCVADAGTYNPDPVTAGCSVSVPLNTEVVVTEDEATLPKGYLPRKNPITLTSPTQSWIDGIPPSAGFLNLLPGDGEDGGITPNPISPYARITIHAATCPANTTGDIYAKCHANELADTKFTVYNPTGHGTNRWTDADGVTSFAPRAGDNRIIETVEARFTSRKAYVFCSDQNTKEVLFDDRVAIKENTLQAKVVVQTLPGAVIVCDWYNLT